MTGDDKRAATTHGVPFTPPSSHTSHFMTPLWRISYSSEAPLGHTSHPQLMYEAAAPSRGGCWRFLLEPSAGEKRWRQSVRQCKVISCSSSSSLYSAVKSSPFCRSNGSSSSGLLLLSCRRDGPLSGGDITPQVRQNHLWVNEHWTFLLVFRRLKTFSLCRPSYSEDWVWDRTFSVEECCFFTFVLTVFMSYLYVPHISEHFYE